MRPGNHQPFRDLLPEDVPRPGVNPYVTAHRAFGHEIITGSDAPALKEKWADVFGRVAPLHLEVGSGNGFYLAGMAQQHPDQDWVGVELRFKRVVLVAKKLRAMGLTNARIVRYDARALASLLPQGSLAGVHINHPDPWERESKRHHRLIDRGFTEVITGLCAPGAELRIKTDFGPHIKALLQACDGLPWEVVGVRTDVDAQGSLWNDDVVTNYQRKARERGVPVHTACLRRMASGSISASAAAPEPQPLPQPPSPAARSSVGSVPSTHSSRFE